MYEFLSKVSDKELLREIKRKTNSLINIKNKSDHRGEILRLLFAIYGYDILYEPSIRRLIIYNCTDTDLYGFCDVYDIDRNNKRYDVANQISTITWRAGSKIVKLFKKVFKINKNYLPVKDESQRSIEVFNGKEDESSLFDYQNEISEQIHKFLSSSDSSCLIQMPTGSGKTRTVLESVINYFFDKNENEGSMKVLWLAHSEELLEQAIQTLKSIWRVKGEDELTVGRLWGAYNSVDDMDEIDVLFTGYMKLISLYKKDKIKYNELKNYFELIIVDEAHKSASNILATLIEDFKSVKDNKIIGLTATPGRSVFDYEENRKLIRLYDGNLITSEILGDNPITFLQKRGVLSKLIPIQKAAGLDDIKLNNNELSLLDDAAELPSSLLKKLATNEKRNKILLNIIKEETSNNRTALVFCCSVEHSRKISVMLASEGIVAASVDYSMRVSARRHIVEDFKSGKIRVLLNYGIFSTGLDVPNIDTVIISRPTNSIVLYSQMIGRGIRGSMVGGTSECRLIDIRDNFTNYGDVDSVYKYFESDWIYKSS